MYKGNAVANAQAIVAKAVLAGEFEKSSLSVERNTISQETLRWVEASPGTPESYLANFLATNDFLCNGDVMGDVNKGVIGLRMDNVQVAKIDSVSVKRVMNLGEVGTNICEYDSTEVSHPASRLPGYQGATTRGLLLAGCEHIKLSNIDVQTIVSYAGAAYGLDIETDSHDICINELFARDVNAGANEDPRSYNSYANNTKNPNKQPLAVGIRVVPTADDVHYGTVHVRDIYGLEGNYRPISNRFKGDQ
jgi:hypothetical protein